MAYTLIKHIHVVAVCVSIAGFALRFLGVQINAHWMSSQPIKVLPHINDSLLLASAITLAVMAGLNPIQHAWLIAKIVALLIYIGLGMLALKSRSRSISMASGLMALVTFSYIVSVALTKSPEGWFGLLPSYG